MNQSGRLPAVAAVTGPIRATVVDPTRRSNSLLMANSSTKFRTVDRTGERNHIDLTGP